jgi:lysophospholipase L1-like esterase
MPHRLRGLIIGMMATAAVVAMPVSALAQTGRAVALGDSVAAGTGLPTDSSDPAAADCHRSRQAWPNLVARRLGLRLTNLACSGASIPDGVLAPAGRAQINLLPPSPRLAMVTVGANDVGYRDFISLCYLWRCSIGSIDLLSQKWLADFQSNLRVLFNRLRPVHRVLATTYYDPFGTSNCLAVPAMLISKAELGWLQRGVTRLNRIIKTVAQGYANVRVVPIDPAFNGHRLCSAHTWVFGPSVLSLSRPFHPTSQGQRRIATLALQVYHRG